MPLLAKKSGRKTSAATQREAGQGRRIRGMDSWSLECCRSGVGHVQLRAVQDLHHSTHFS
jgi:hypothetical protein